ncbi:MAG: lysophospholipid acyltransferase family protein [Rhodoferax sp.]
MHILYAAALASIYPYLNRARQRNVLQAWSSTLLAILNVRLLVNGAPPQRTDSGHLLVANHVSWLDILAINAASPVRFVAKSEVSAWPLFGWLVRRSGALFIRRGLRRDTLRITQAIEHLLRDGDHIALFPQGTSTDASQPVHFHSSTLQGAIDAQAAVRPLAISYHDDVGHPMPQVAFIGEMTFLQSLWAVLRLRQVHAHVRYLPLLDCNTLTRREVAVLAQDCVNATLMGRYGQDRAQHSLAP